MESQERTTPAPQGPPNQEHTMYTVMITLRFSNYINEFATCKTLDRAVKMADSLKLEAWVINTETREVLYTNR